MTMSANMLHNSRDKYLKYCSKDVAEDDIGRLRKSSFTHNKVFLVSTFRTLSSGPM